ncbi:MAG: phosphodiester glycosidase family protein [Caulobacterales bacterium]|nr:phosphodiester glycosidase family protein [Caulobacterales bacterium]
MKRLVLAAIVLLAAGSGFVIAATRPAGPCRIQTFKGDRFTVCRYTPAQHEIRLTSGPRSLPALKRSLGPDAGRVLFAMNAGMYDPAGKPVGLFVAGGRTGHPLTTGGGEGNFFLLPNGVFWIDASGGAHVDETVAFAAAARPPVWATQSGPLLVASSKLHPKIAPEGVSRLIRNGVGVKGGEAFFVISEQSVSFGRFARFLRDGLGCADALYLDGVVSSLWAPPLGRIDDRTDLGPLLVVLKRP